MCECSSAGGRRQGEAEIYRRMATGQESWGVTVMGKPFNTGALSLF